MNTGKPPEITLARKLTGAEMIACERERQIEDEGFGSAHDAQHVDGELVQAAICYAQRALLQPNDFYHTLIPSHWPWGRDWWKSGTSIRMLTKAGALIAAEIDRRAARGESE